MAKVNFIILEGTISYGSTWFRIFYRMTRVCVVPGELWRNLTVEKVFRKDIHIATRSHSQLVTY